MTLIYWLFACSIGFNFSLLILLMINSREKEWERTRADCFQHQCVEILDSWERAARKNAEIEINNMEKEK